MTLFTERQAAVKVLYSAAGQLLDDAGDAICSAGRQLCRDRALECVELAEKIACMGPVKITPDKATYLEVEGVPFSLGFTTKTKPPLDAEDDDKS